jgi:hypothetical protein
MTYPILRLLHLLHLLGLTLMAAGLIGVWYADLRSRSVRELVLFAEVARTIAVLDDRPLTGFGSAFLVAREALGDPPQTTGVALEARRVRIGRPLTPRHGAVAAPSHVDTARTSGHPDASAIRSLTL